MLIWGIFCSLLHLVHDNGEDRAAERAPSHGVCDNVLQRLLSGERGHHPCVHPTGEVRTGEPHVRRPNVQAGHTLCAYYHRAHHCCRYRAYFTSFARIGLQVPEAHTHGHVQEEGGLVPRSGAPLFISFCLFRFISLQFISIFPPPRVFRLRRVLNFELKERFAAFIFRDFFELPEGFDFWLARVFYCRVNDTFSFESCSSTLPSVGNENSFVFPQRIKQMKILLIKILLYLFAGVGWEGCHPDNEADRWVAWMSQGKHRQPLNTICHFPRVSPASFLPTFRISYLEYYQDLWVLCETFKCH